MEHSFLLINQKKRIALVAHDNKKQDLLEWARFNKVLLANHEEYQETQPHTFDAAT